MAMLPFRRTEWKKIKLDDGAYESAAAFDVNNDGIIDIVCGANWYEGPPHGGRASPRWIKHKLCELELHSEYYDDFSTIPMDVNGDGYLDVITGGWFGETLVWRENPKGKPVEWQTHVIDKCGNIETTRAYDVDGDGQLEILPNTPGHPLSVYKLITDDKGRGTGAFQKHTIFQGPSGHGLGFGDITGDGRGCFVLRNGWLEQSGDPLSDPWTFHPDFDLGSASVPILVVDLNNDGLAELIVGQAHGYGLDYYQQTLQPTRHTEVGQAGRRTWTKHPIDPYFSQYHVMEWVDIDNDGQCELITGNRYRAHNGHEPGETEVVGLYCFKWNGESFTKQVIDHGLVPNASGTGIYFSIADLDGDGRLDIVAPGKDGLYIFINLGPENVGK